MNLKQFTPLLMIGGAAVAAKVGGDYAAEQSTTISGTRGARPALLGAAALFAWYKGYKPIAAGIGAMAAVDAYGAVMGTTDAAPADDTSDPTAITAPAPAPSMSGTHTSAPKASGTFNNPLDQNGNPIGALGSGSNTPITNAAAFGPGDNLSSASAGPLSALAGFFQPVNAVNNLNDAGGRAYAARNNAGIRAYATGRR